MTSCNGDAVTSRSPVLDPRKNETLDVVTSKKVHKLAHDNYRPDQPQVLFTLRFGLLINLNDIID